LRQCDVAEKIGVNTHDISNYENLLAVPDLEDMIILEQEFNTRIDWGEDLKTKERHDIVQDIIILSEKYPLVAVFSFATKAIREGIRTGSPGKLVQYYTRLSEDEIKGLYPPEVKDDCQDCEF